MFYGEGAGTRSKLIKAKVEGKSKKDPSYKKAFDNHLGKQDMSKHAEKARGERKRKNIKKSTGRGIRGTRHILNGNSQYASAATAILVGGAPYAHKKGIDKAVLKSAKNFFQRRQEGCSEQAEPEDCRRSLPKRQVLVGLCLYLGKEVTHGKLVLSYEGGSEARLEHFQ